MKPKLNLRWRTTTALCIVSTMAVATVALAAGNIGVSSWDLRSHPNRFTNLLADAHKPAGGSN
jgi:phospholipase C